MNALLTLLFVSLCGAAHAIRLPLVAREVPSAFRLFDSDPTTRLGKVRVDQNIENERDVVYATTITIGGVETPIQLDTGSSDLWFQPPGPTMPKFTNTTKIGTNLTYGIGFAEGQVQFADVEFGSHTVKNQAVLNVTRAVDLGAIKSNGINGIMGLGFDIGSAITVKMGEVWGTDGAKKGLTFMSNIFAQNKTTPNMFSVLLGRAYDRDGPEDGAFTIGEYVEGYEEIAQQPKLYRTPAQLGPNITQIPRWTVQLDSMKVNGKAFQFNKSSVPEAAAGRQVVLLDTGYTFSQLPKAAVDFIYSTIPGAHYNASNGYWQVPCNETTKLSFQFEGLDIPIDPLDITGVKTIGNDTVCINSYRTFNLPPGATAGLDFILGDSFLKNVYISYDFGDATLSETTDGLPFVQMLPTTDLKSAMEDYQTVRDRQIRKNDQKIKESGGIALEDPLTEEIAIAPATGPSLGDLNKSLGNLGKRRRAQMEAVPVPVPVPVNSAAEVPKIVFATVHEQQQVPVPVPVMRVHHHVMKCMHVIHKHFGAVAVALLAGTFGIVFMMALVAAALGIRMLVRRRRAADGYESLEEAKGEIVFQVDEQFYDNATNGLTPPRYA